MWILSHLLIAWRLKISNFKKLTKNKQKNQLKSQTPDIWYIYLIYFDWRSSFVSRQNDKRSIFYEKVRFILLLLLLLLDFTFVQSEVSKEPKFCSHVFSRPEWSIATNRFFNCSKIEIRNSFFTVLIKWNSVLFSKFLLNSALTLSTLFSHRYYVCHWFWWNYINFLAFIMFIF